MQYRFAKTDEARLVALTPEHWRRKAAAMRFERERLQELAAGGLLAEMLGSADLAVAVTAEGKPYLPACPAKQFSLSHSEEMVMCMVDDVPCGCDVEKVVLLEEDVLREIGSLEEWVRREAAFKCGVADGICVRNVPAPEGYVAAVAYQEKNRTGEQDE